MDKELSIEILTPTIDLLSYELKSAIYNLNQVNIPALGAINDFEHVQQLYDFCTYCYLAFKQERLIAFVFVMDESSLYQSPNYQYFKLNYDSFLYIDRVAVSDLYQRKGIGSELYNHIYLKCIEANIPLCCEVNTLPRNEVSLNFHLKLNFKITEERPFGKKKVAMLIKE
tara:strand:+ start:245 stop:754 length:510 start_codon:yes stop_codon:yes gene_type:complete